MAYFGAIAYDDFAVSIMGSAEAVFWPAGVQVGACESRLDCPAIATFYPYGSMCNVTTAINGGYQDKTVQATIAGTVSLALEPVGGRMVRIHERTTGRLVAELISNEFGDVSITANLPSTYYVVAFPYSADQTNAVIFDNIVAVV